MEMWLVYYYPSSKSEAAGKTERPQERGLRKQKVRMFHFPPVQLQDVGDNHSGTKRADSKSPRQTPETSQAQTQATQRAERPP